MWNIDKHYLSAREISVDFILCANFLTIFLSVFFANTNFAAIHICYHEAEPNDR